MLGLKNKSTLGSWEIGKSEPDYIMIGKLCEVFGVDANTFFEWETDALPHVSGFDENGEYVAEFSEEDTLEIIRDMAKLPPEAIGDMRLFFEFMYSKYNKGK
jgi:transcriptional regulator with XRE-family HTH domain